MDHMQMRHSMRWTEQIHTERWHCDVDHNETGNDIPEFNDKAQFLEHLKTCHGDKLTQSKILGRIRRNRRIATRDPFVCPLCDCVPTDVERHVRQGEKPYALLWEHISQHLKSMAFLSLSYVADDLEHNESSAHTSTQASDKNDTNIFNESLSESSHHLYCDRDSCDCGDREKSSTLDWSSLEATFEPSIVGIPEGQLPTSHDDPRYALATFNGWPMQSEWEFWHPLSLPPDCKRIGPPDYQNPIGLLAKQIRKYCTLVYDNKQILPEDKVQNLIRRLDVGLILGSTGIPRDDISALVDFVCNESQERTGRQLFLTLVMVSTPQEEKVSFLRRLMAEGVDDSALPIGFYTGGAYEHQGYSLEDPDKGRFPVFVNGDFEEQHRILFSVHQWCFLAPVFGAGRFRFRFHSDRRLPYTNLSPGQVSSGFFSEVSRAEMLAAHMPRELRVCYSLPLPPLHRPFFEHHLLTQTQVPGRETFPIAIKKVRGLDGHVARLFNDEADNLERIQLFGSIHLVKPIAAYEHGQDKCLIFHWADGGNLHSYWKNHEAEATEKLGVQWILYQFAGICSALEELHENNCRHGDLKPENILWFCDPALGVRTGNLQIADLGLTTFHEKDAQTKERRAQNLFTLDSSVTSPTQRSANPIKHIWDEVPIGQSRKGASSVSTSMGQHLPTSSGYDHANALSGTSRYEPPEMDKDRGENPVRSREYDIWSMGCILLELLVWLLEGYETLVDFQRRTTYFWVRQFQDGRGWYEVSSYVRNTMDEIEKGLKALPDETQLYQDLLSIVCTRLLVVEVSDEYMSHPGERVTARVLHRLVRDICEKCHPDSSYLTVIRLPKRQTKAASGAAASLLPVPGILVHRPADTLPVNQPSNNQHVSIACFGPTHGYDLRSVYVDIVLAHRNQLITATFGIRAQNTHSQLEYSCVCPGMKSSLMLKKAAPIYAQAAAQQARTSSSRQPAACPAYDPRRRAAVCVASYSTRCSNMI